MADFRARQRVGLHDGTNEFGFASGSPFFVSIQDGGNSITVDGTVAVSGISGTVTVDANSSDVTVDNGAGASAVNIQDGGNSITVDGTVTVTDGGSTISIDDGAGSITVDGTVAVSSVGGTVTIQDGGNSITVDGSVTVSASALDIRDLDYSKDNVEIMDSEGDALKVNDDGSINVVISGSAGTRIHSYDTSSAIAKDASDDHDYAVTGGKTLLLKQVIVAASGAMKVTIQAGPVASLVTYAVVFTSGAKPTEVITFEEPISVPSTSTGTVRVTRRNDDSQAMDVYSTIIGVEV